MASFDSKINILRLAVLAQRNQRDLVLQRVNLRVVVRCAGAINAAENPDNAGWRFMLGDTRGKRAGPWRTRDDVVLRPLAGGPRSRDLEDIRLAAQHRHHEETSS